MRDLTLLRIRASLVAAIAFILSISTFPQTSPKSAADKPLRFDVVSIRPGLEGSKRGINILPDGYESIEYPLEETVYIAYVPAPFFKHLEEVKGFPSWATSEKYNVRAKIAPEDAERWRSLQQNIMKTSVVLQSMLRSVLAERCNLQIHSQGAMTNAYALVRRANAPPLTESTELPSAGTIMELTDGARPSLKCGTESAFIPSTTHLCPFSQRL